MSILLKGIDMPTGEQVKTIIISSDGTWESFLVKEINGEAVEVPTPHGKLVDISKLDEDRIDGDNPIIYMTINGEYIEAINLDYLNNLPTVVEAEE